MASVSPVIHVLHLEDSDLDAEFVHHRLVKGGLVVEVERAKDRPEFTEKLQEKPYDLILSDYQVPTFDDLAALDLAKKYQPDTPFIFVSGMMGEELAVESLKRGAVDYVLKDRIARLSSAVERALGDAKVRADRRRAEEDRARFEERYQTLFDSIDQGFCVVEVIFDENDQPIDYRYLEVNKAFERHSGLSDAQGKRIRELVPDIDAHWVELYGKVIRTGEPVRYVNCAEAMGKWFDVSAFRLGGRESNKVSILFTDITDRRKAEETLKGSQERLRLATDTAELGIWIWDVATDRVIWENDRPYAMFGIPNDRKPVNAERFVDEFVHPDDAEAFREATRETIENQTRFYFLGRFYRTDGELRWAEFTGKALSDADGSTLKLIGTAADVTNRKLAEDELQASKDRLQFALKAGRMGTWDLDIASLRLHASDICKTNYGRMPTDTLTYEDLKALIVDEDRDYWQSVVDGAIQAADDFKMEYRIRLPDRSIRWIHVRGSCAKDHHGVVRSLTGVSFDITERKEAEAELARLLADVKHHAAILERLAQASKAVNAVLSIDGIAEILTEEARSIIGAEKAATLLFLPENGPEPTKTISEDDDASSASETGPDMLPLRARVNRTNRPLSLTAQMFAEYAKRGAGRRESKKPWPAGGWLGVPLIGHGGQNLGLVELLNKQGGEFTPEDKSILVQLAAIAAVGIENARFYDRLREQDQRKDEFLATLAHELRNPLAPVRTGLTVLKQSSSPEQTRQAKLMMERQLGHMVRLIDDLLDVSRISSGKFELKRQRVELQSMVDSALEVSRSSIEQGRHELVVNTPEESIHLLADPTRIAQVISNLLNNAAKYTPEGGRIELSVTAEGTEVLIRVVDNGVGVAPEMLPKIFEMFTQVGRTIDRAQGGLGIGLSLVSRLTEMHGGSVSAESGGLGKGSTFLVRLPQAKPLDADEPLPLQDDPSIGSEFVNSPRRILVVDDNEDIARCMEMLFKIGGHETRMVHNGPDAVAAFRDFQPDIVFLDIGLPGMNGYEVAKSLRAESLASHSPILVAVTGWGSEEDRRRSKEAGFDLHLVKPVDPDLIVGLLKKTLEGREKAVSSPGA